MDTARVAISARKLWMVTANRAPSQQEKEKKRKKHRKPEDIKHDWRGLVAKSRHEGRAPNAQAGHGRNGSKACIGR